MNLDVRDRTRLVRSFWKRFTDADPSLLAAAIAFNAFFALVPSAFAFVTAASFIGRDGQAIRRFEEVLASVVPPSVADFIADLLAEVAAVAEGQQGIIIGASVLIALFSGSRGVVALQRGLARIEGLPEHRPIWRRRLVAIGLTMGAAIALGLASGLLITSGRLIDVAVELTGWEPLRTVRVWVGFPAAAAGLYLFLLSVYRWGPPQPLPGARWSAVASSIAVITTSVGMGFLLASFELSSTFGVLGSIAVVLAWLYITTAVLLLSAALVGFGWRRRNE